MSGLEPQQVSHTSGETDPVEQIPPPDYEIDEDSPISEDDDSLDFYEACAEGDVGEIASFIEELHPNNGDRQYGLELATHHGNIAAIRYLLEQGTRLHRNVFERRVPNPERFNPTYANILWRLESIFDGVDQQEKGLLVLQTLQLFHEFGWRPNHAWVRDGDREKHYMFVLAFVLSNKLLVEWLLDHGANPNVGRPGQVVGAAACGHNIEILELLVSRGARLNEGAPLHSLSVIRGGKIFSRDLSGRFKMAEWLVKHGVDINGVKGVRGFCMVSAGDDRVDCTPLSRACALMDWEFVEQLLDLGADPEAENRMAYSFNPRLFWQPQQHEVNRLEEIVEKWKKKSDGEN